MKQKGVKKDGDSEKAKIEGGDAVQGERKIEGRDAVQGERKVEGAAKGEEDVSAKPSTSKQSKITFDPHFSELFINVGTSGEASSDELAAMSFFIDDFVGKKKM